MKFRAATQRLLLFAQAARHARNLHQQPRHFSTFFRKVQSSAARASINGGGGGGGGRRGSSQGNSFFVPGATVGTVLMLGALHARRLYDDKKVSLSPSTLEKLKVMRPVDGTVLRFGELKEAGAMIEQVKGFSYSVSSLLGAKSFLPMTACENIQQESGGEDKSMGDETQKSWWRVSLASPKVRAISQESPMKGLFYCVIYLKPGDYHRIHSPVDWNVLVRRHFSGRLYPLNERAMRTIRNLYVENERVVLEGQWQEGYMAMAAIGATNIGSIELFVEPTLHTNRPRKKLLHSEPPEERVYEPEGSGIMLKKGDEVGAFNMGSTVVLVFQAPVSSANERMPSDFKFCIERGDRIRMGEALGRWHDA